MMRIINQLITWVLLFTSLSLQAENQERILHPKGLLWKIEKSGAPPSHLYGTMHVADPRVVHLAEPVEKAFKSSERFAMEMLLNFHATGVVASGTFFNDGRTLKSIMRSDDYQRMSRLLHETMYLTENTYNHMRPWAILMLLMMPDQSHLADQTALDMVLYRSAAIRKMPLLGLETPEEQLAIFESLTVEDQLWMLNKSVETYGRISSQMPDMLDAYLDRDLARLVKLQNDSMYDDSEVDDRFMYQLLDKRNLRMVERMQNYLQQGKAFIAIGALHLPGEKGVLHLLEQQGYSVTPVY